MKNFFKRKKRSRKTNIKFSYYKRYRNIKEIIEKRYNILIGIIVVVNLIIIGNGERVIDQYPYADLVVNNKSRLFLVTNNQEYTLPSFWQWGARDVLTYCQLTNLDCQFNGYGYVVNQDLKAGTKVKAKDVINIELELKVN